MKKTIVSVIAATAMIGMAACSSTRTQRAAGEQVDDAALLTSVKSALVSNTVTEAGEINVDVNRGVVKLSGFVDSSQEKSKAAQVAGSVDGVKSVQNDIAVQTKNESTGEVIDDSVLTAKVKTALITSLGDEGSPDQRRDQARHCSVEWLRRQRGRKERRDDGCQSQSQV